MQLDSKSLPISVHSTKSITVTQEGAGVIHLMKKVTMFLPEDDSTIPVTCLHCCSFQHKQVLY